VRTGRQLFQEHEGRESPAFTWLGQHSFILSLAGHVILIDPFLADMPERLVSPLFRPADAQGAVTLTVCTHDHIDHLDPVAVSGLTVETGTHFVVPRACRARMLDLGVPEERLTLLDDGESARFGELEVTAVKSAHESFDVTPEGHHPWLGFVLRGEGRSVYHAGDTVWWEGLQARLRSCGPLDLALLPINGRDGERYRQGVLGNMTYQEAADLAGGLDLALLVPTHYGMFESNTVDPGLFASYMDAKYPLRRYLLPVLSEITGF